MLKQVFQKHLLPHKLDDFYTLIFKSNSSFQYVVFEINKKFNVLTTSLSTLITTRMCDSYQHPYARSNGDANVHPEDESTEVLKSVSNDNPNLMYERLFTFTKMFFVCK